MCGITGWIDWEQNLTGAEAVIQKMASTLTNRGPDASGIWLSRHAALGHKRLIVIDPEGGAQPMVLKRGKETLVITYNGEIYNMFDLKRELTARGHIFQSRSDTEVVLQSYLEWGEECAAHLNGIFAFAIWDEGRQCLFMARDRLGVKPLFFSALPKGLVYGSELKAILAHPSVEPEVTAEGLAEIFALGPARTPGHGVFKGIEELKPGCWLRYDVNGLCIRPYWKLESREHPDDLAATVAKVGELLIDTVERQLISDVPVSALLSGGLDSSTLTALAVRTVEKEGRGKLRSYSVDYAGNDENFQSSDFQPNSDGDWVPIIADYLGTDHTTVLLDSPELAAALKDAVIARDLPGMADVDSSLLLFSRRIKENATVAISGECADEVFGGYPWFRRRDALEASTFPWSLQSGLRRRVISDELAAAISLDEYLDRRYREALAEVPRYAGDTPSEARIREIFYLSLTRWMPVLLDRKDRMSMAAGLEIRVPFCDHRLVEYVWNVPWSMKTTGGALKGLLRQAMQGFLPAEILERPKSPYPKTFNPSYLSAVRAMLREVLNDPASPLLPLINRSAVCNLMDYEIETIDTPWFGQLMTGPQLLAYLYQVNFWLKEYHVRIL